MRIKNGMAAAATVSMLSLALMLSSCSRATPEELLQRAQDYQARSEISAAIIELKNALQQNPKFGEARLMLGRLYLTYGNPVSALKELERALDAGVEKARVLQPLLTAKNRLGRYQEVLGELEKLTAAKQALSPALLVVQGRAYLAAKDPAKAQAAFASALAEKPEFASATLGLAAVAWLQGDLVKAAGLFDKAASQDLKNRDIWLQKGEFELARRQPQAAQKSFANALVLPGPKVVPQMGIARAQLILKQLPEAEKTVDAVLKRAPDYPMANYLKALVRYQSDDIQGAETALLKVLTRVPNHYPSLYMMGIVKYRQQQYAQAEDKIGRFLARFPDNLSARKLLATMQLQQQHPAAALETLEPYAATISDAQGLAILGTAYLQNGRLSEATEALQTAADLNPDMSEIRTRLALSLLASGDNTGAVAELESAVKLDQNVVRNDVLLVLIALRQGQLDNALKRAEDFQQRHPDNAIAINLVGAVQLAKADTQAAINSFKRALKVDSGFRPAVTNLARIQESKGDLAGARKLYTDFLQSHPTDMTARVALAQLALKAGDLEGAKQYLEQARTANAKALLPRLLLSRLALKQNHPEEANALLREALKIAPTKPEVQLLRARLEIARRDTDQAREALDVVQRFVDERGVKQIRPLLQLATLQMQTNDLSQARKNLELALAQGSGKNVAALAALTRLELRAGDADAAGKRLQALVALVPDHAGLSLLKGDVAQLRGELKDAQKYYQSGVDADNRQATLKLVGLYERQGDHPAAIDLMQRWLQKKPADDGVRLALGSVYLSTGANAQAIAIYQTLQHKAPNNAVVLNNLAWLYLQQGDTRAEKLARRAHALAPNSADVTDTLGWILLQQGEADEALALFQQAVAQNAGNPSIGYHLGLAYATLKREAEALDVLRGALEKGDFPERAQAEALLQKISS